MTPVFIFEWCRPRGFERARNAERVARMSATHGSAKVPSPAAKAGAMEGRRLRRANPPFHKRYLPFPALLLRRSHHSAISGVLCILAGNYNLLWLLLRANIRHSVSDYCGFALRAAPFHAFRPEAFGTPEPFSGDS